MMSLRFFNGAMFSALFGVVSINHFIRRERRNNGAKYLPPPRPGPVKEKYAICNFRGLTLNDDRIVQTNFFAHFPIPKIPSSLFM